MDSCGAAMEPLLKRQAELLVELHTASVEQSRSDHGVDEDLLQTRLNDLATIAMSKFYAYRFDRVPYYWRQIYTDTLILKTHYQVLRSLFKDGQFREAALDVIVELCDRALITAGGAGRLLGAPWIEKTLELLEKLWLGHRVEERPQKRQRTDDSPGSVFPATEPHGRPTLSPDRECPRHSNWTVGKFEDYMNEGKGAPSPILFTDLIRSWPALTDRPWKSSAHLLSRTFGGRRLVPVEVGRSYVDKDWGQELIQFKDFLAKYVDPSIGSSGGSSTPAQVGYLAQHNLFQQIPSLRNDILIPDFCWAVVPPHPCGPSKDHPPVSVPHLNAWLGPARTITPLHTDAYHNLLCQVVGAKYVRLYPPAARLRPRPPEGGIDMSNTSAVDVGVLEGWDDPSGEEDVQAMRKEMEGVEYWECILEPGHTLVIPMGWWHYVRSLSVSFSVSFWWN